MSRRSQVYFDPAPLLEQARLGLDLPAVCPSDRTVRTLCDGELAAYIGVSRETVCRWKAGRRITTLVADRTAIALGLHPLNIWPDWGQHDDEDQEVA